MHIAHKLLQAASGNHANKADVMLKQLFLSNVSKLSVLPEGRQQNPIMFAVKKCGHAVQLERPEGVLHVLTSVLSDLH